MPRSEDGNTDTLVPTKDLLRALENKKDELEKKWNIISLIIFVREQFEIFKEAGSKSPNVPR